MDAVHRVDDAMLESGDVGVHVIVFDWRFGCIRRPLEEDRGSPVTGSRFDDDHFVVDLEHLEVLGRDVVELVLGDGSAFEVVVDCSDDVVGRDIGIEVRTAELFIEKFNIKINRKRC